MKKALVEPSGRVAQIEPINQDPESDGIPFPVHAALKWIDCPDNTTTEHRYAAGAFVDPPPSLAVPQSLVDQIIADPAQMAKLKAALAQP